MQITNQEFNFDPVFVQDDGNRYGRFADLATEKLNPRIYFEPASSPRLSRWDSRIGSCFSGWTIPTPSLTFYADQGTITGQTELEQNTSLVEYQALVVRHIQSTIEKCYRAHNEVYLAYSGSLDSSVVLSYIMKMGLAYRTHIRCFLNLATDHPNALKHDQSRINRINDFFNHHRGNFASVGWEKTDINDIVELINQGKNYHHLISYTLSSIFDRYRDSAWIGGFHGNRTLLHQRMFLDQIRICDPARNNELKILIDRHWREVYSPSIKKLDLSADPVHMKYHTQSQKPWHMISGWQNNKIYMPLASEDLFLSLRALDPAELTFNLIADATFGKELLASNSPELLPWVDRQQSSHEQDNLENISLPMKNLDLSQLEIPLDLNHDPTGLEWITGELGRARSRGEIEINSVVSIKNLQWIRSMILV